jgi:Lrp/AsnC family transcriptional regulator for asnA, asnC and gidA
MLWVSGRFDLLVEIVCDDDQGLTDFLETQIYSADDIAAVEVMSGLEMFKNQFLLKRDLPL